MIISKNKYTESPTSPQKEKKKQKPPALHTHFSTAPITSYTFKLLLPVMVTSHPARQIQSHTARIRSYMIKRGLVCIPSWSKTLES